MEKKSQQLDYDNNEFSCNLYLWILHGFHINLIIIQHNKCVDTIIGQFSKLR